MKLAPLLAAQWRALVLSAGFLTRLAPARAATDAEMAAGVAHYPLVGLLTGLVCAGPFLLGLLGGHPWVQALGYAALLLWATRGLHWDGWADLMDAWGSSATGDRFWDILKDSRIGAFGVLGIVFGVLGQMVLAHEVITMGRAGALVWAPVLGRAACVVLAAFVPPGTRSTLGRLTSAGATHTTLLFCTGVAAATGVALAGPPAVLAAALPCACAVAWLAALARREGGLNGDFLGACIILGELSALLGTTLA